MKHTRLNLAWLGLAATALLAQGCAPQASWNGVFKMDLAGAARVCVAATASPPDGQTSVVQMQVSNEGGWCGVNATRGGVPFESYLLAARPAHGKIYAHRVGGYTRIDYTPDTGFAGTDTFAVRLIPGNAAIQGAVSVTR